MVKQYSVIIRGRDGTFITKYLSAGPIVPASERKTLRAFTPSIVSEINQGQGQLNIDLDALFDDFGEGVDVKHGNIVELYLYDNNHPSPDGILLYTGVITTYESHLDGVVQGVQIQPIGTVSQLSTSYFKVGGNLEFNYNDKASELFKAVIDHFSTVYTDTSIAYDESSVEDSVTTIDKDFSKTKWFDALKEAKDLAPAGWWWRIEPDGLAVFKSKPSTATHSFQMQRHVESIKVNKTIDSVFNDIVLESSAPSTPHTATDSTSITDYGLRTLIISDTSINDDTTAAERVDKELAERKDPKRRITIVINEQYDLETIKPGDTCTIFGEKIGSTLLTENMQIVRVSYNPYSVELILEEDYQNLAKQLEKFNN